MAFLTISGQFFVGFRAGKILGGKVSPLEVSGPLILWNS